MPTSMSSTGLIIILNYPSRLLMYIWQGIKQKAAENDNMICRPISCLSFISIYMTLGVMWSSLQLH